MALSESSPFTQRESPTSLKLSEASKNLDSRGISYGEYEPRKQMEAIPRISQVGLKEVIQYLERDGAPKDLTSALAKIDAMIESHMKYDAMNYLLGDIVDIRPESFTATIDPEKIGISEGQIKVLQKQILKLQKRIGKIREAYNFEAEFPDLKIEIQNLEDIKKMLNWPYGIDIAELLANDREYTLAHHATYRVSIGKLLKEGVGQCHTFAALAKLLLENEKWNLGIANIVYLASPSGDHTVLKIVMRNGEKVIWDGTRGMVGRGVKK